MLFKVLVEYSNRLKKVSSRNAKLEIISDFLGKLKKDEAEIGVDFIAGRIRQGRLNIAWQGLSQLMKTPTEKLDNSPRLIEIDEILEKTKSARGREKIKILEPLFSRLSTLEKRFLVSVILRDIQQGAGEGLVKMAIARFFDLEDSDIEYANMHEPDLGKLFLLLLKKGKDGVKNLGIKLFYPVKPMLAEIGESLEDIFQEYSEFALEDKLDGIRIQLHKQGDEVKIFSRHLKDITLHFPELLEVAKRIPAKEFILDGEAVSMGKNGRVLPFQILARRITRKKDIEILKKSIPVVPKFFDVLYVEGSSLASRAYTERWKILNNMIKNKNYLATRTLPTTKTDGFKFMERSLQNGNEGVMVKLLNAPYQAGKRGNFWFKIKSSYTIDCIILAAEWGHGRRKGWLSNLHLGVLDETKTKFLMVGKTFKGVTDKMLEWLTDNLQKIKVHEDAWTLYVKPEIVVEIKFNGVQKSPKYDSGYALRFARVTRIRNDKPPREINTILDLEKFAKIGGVNEL